MIYQIGLISLIVAVVVSMPVEGDEQVIGGRSVPHPNSAAGKELANKDLSGQTGGRSVPHPNSAAGQELANKNLSGMTGGSAVPHPSSDAGRALANKDLGEEKSVLEGGTQVKPWLKNQPKLHTSQ